MRAHEDVEFFGAPPARRRASSTLTERRLGSRPNRSVHQSLRTHILAAFDYSLVKEPATCRGHFDVPPGKPQSAHILSQTTPATFVTVVVRVGSPDRGGESYRRPMPCQRLPRRFFSQRVSGTLPYRLHGSRRLFIGLQAWPPFTGVKRHALSALPEEYETQA